MQYQNDPKRAAMLRDLLMDYPVRQAENAPPPPPGIDPESPEGMQFYDAFENSDAAHEFQQEGNYPNAEMGHPDARMALEGQIDPQMIMRLRELMPRAQDRVAPVPMQPMQDRKRMLAQMLGG